MSSLQMTPPDSEPTIAGKTHFEILSMPSSTRCRWYKMISPEEKEEAMRVVSVVRRAKSSAARTEYWKDPKNIARISGEYNPTKRPEVKAKQRACWTPEKKAEKSKAMSGRVLSKETKAKISGENHYLYGKQLSEETKTKLRKAHTGKILTKEHRAKIGVASAERQKDPEYRARMSASLSGENNHFFDKTHSEETKAKMSVAMTGRTLSEEHKAKIGAAGIGRVVSEETRIKVKAAWTPEKRAKQSAANKGENNPMYGKTRSPTEETRAKNSAANMGEKNSNWRGGISFEPYCHLWSEPLRERYRNHYGRVCVLTDTLRSVMGPGSGLDDFEGHEIFNGRRLSVHHIRGDKMSGCDGTELVLVPLQGKFNTTKFDGLKLEDHPFYITLFLLKDQERRYREEILELVQ